MNGEPGDWKAEFNESRIVNRVASLKSRFRSSLVCLIAAAVLAVAIVIFTHLPNDKVPNLIVRAGDDKFRHVLSYGFLGVLLSWGLRIWVTSPVKTLAWVLASGTGFAALDEVTQPLTGRTCSLTDFFASFGGTLLGGGVMCLVGSLTRQRHGPDSTPPEVSLSVRAGGGRESAPRIWRFWSWRKRRWLTLLAAFVGGCVCLAGLGYAFPQQFLCVENRAVKADILIVPGGAGGERARWAAQLYKQGLAPRILLTGAGDHHWHRTILVAAGVPREVILIESRSKTTRENAEFSATLLREQGIRSAIMATSWYHSRRALAAFRHFVPDVQFTSSPSHYAYARADWKQSGIDRFVWQEYAKLAGYWLRHGISPF